MIHSTKSESLASSLRLPKSARAAPLSRKEGREMYHKVLVPLDGSKLAECALTHVKTMVKEGFAGDVTLLNVVHIDAPYSELYGKNFDITVMRKSSFAAASKYLADVEARLGTEGIRGKTGGVDNKPQ